MRWVNKYEVQPTRFSYCCYVNLQLKRHEAEDGEDGEARDKAGGTVQQAQGKRIPVNRKETLSFSKKKERKKKENVWKKFHCPDL